MQPQIFQLVMSQDRSLVANHYAAKRRRWCSRRLTLARSINQIDIDPEANPENFGWRGMQFWKKLNVNRCKYDRAVSEEVKNFAIGPICLKFDSRDSKIGQQSPTARHRRDVFVLPKRYAAEMNPTTRNASSA